MAKKEYPTTNSEAKEQESLFHWATLQSSKKPELQLLYHIPNGGSRNILESANLKRQGVKAGVPDICLPVARGKYHGLYIELKANKNKPSKKQEYWLGQLTEQGYCAITCWGFLQAMEAIVQYLREV